MAEKNPVIFDGDNPEWTEADFARAKRGDAIPAHIRAAFPKRVRGAQAAPIKQAVSIRLDADLLERLRASGAGWQGRVNDMLRKAMG